MTTTFGGPALSSSEFNSPVVAVVVHTCLPDADRVIVSFSSLDASGEGDEGLVVWPAVDAVVCWGGGEGCAAEEEEGWSGV